MKNLCIVFVMLLVSTLSMGAPYCNRVLSGSATTNNNYQCVCDAQTTVSDSHVIDIALNSSELLVCRNEKKSDNSCQKKKQPDSPVGYLCVGMYRSIWKKSDNLWTCQAAPKNN